MRIRLRGKTLLLCALLAASPVLVAWLMGAYDAWTSWRYRQHLESAASELVARVESGGDLGDASVELEVYTRRLDRDGEVVFASDPRYGDGRFSRSGWFAEIADFFYGPGGSPKLIEAEAAQPALAGRPEVAAALSGEAASARRTTPSANAFVFYRAVPLADGGALYLARLSRRSARALYDHRYQLLKMTLLVLLLAIGVAIVAGRSVVRPLVDMQSKVADHLDSNAELDLGVDRSDEIGELAGAFEELAARMRERATRASAASAELAHDLKSPISALLASADLLESGDDDPARLRRIAAAVRRAGEHLDNSVGAFMAMAELDESLASTAREPTDVAAIASEVVADVAAMPQHADVAFEVSAPAPARVAGKPERIAQLVRNLVDNAADFAASRVRVSIRARGDRVELEVADDGPGVTGASRARVFERFFSGRPARRGRGLGLAIVRTVAEAYGGRVELLDERPLGGAAFRVWLPRSPM